MPAGEPVVDGRRPVRRHRGGPGRRCWRDWTTAVAAPAAYVLPLHRREDELGWASADWRLRRGRIVLLAGDSPAGLRLPLDSISWEPPRPTFEADPLAERDELPDGMPGQRTIARTSRTIRTRTKTHAHHGDGRRDS